MIHLIFFFIFIIHSQLNSAQSYTHVGARQGLSNRKVYGIQKDDKGYMWFLTNDGIDRYNGKEIKTYMLYDNGEKIKSRYNMNWLLKDSVGTLWEVGQRGRVFSYSQKQDEFVLTYKIPPSTNARQHMSSISACTIDQDNNLWLCRDTSEIYIYNIREKTVAKHKNLLNKIITSIQQKDSNVFYFGTEQGIHLVELKDGRLRRIENQTVDTIYDQISNLYYNRKDKILYAGTFRKGIIIYEENKDALANPHQNLKDINISKIIPYTDKDLLIATDGSGIFRMDRKTYALEPYITDDHKNINGPNGNCITDLFLDDERRIWIANYPYDITVRHNKYAPHKVFRHATGNRQTLIDDNVNSIIEDSEHDLWFATNNGISMFNTKDKTWHSYLNIPEQSPTPQNHIFLTICEVQPGIIWSGGYGSGIYQIEKKTGKTKILNNSEYGNKKIKTDKYIRIITKSADGVIWAGGYFNLKRIDLNKKLLTPYPGLSGITEIIRRDDEHMWIGTANGLFLLYTESGVFSRLVLPVTATYINTLYQDADNRLYIGTDGSGLVIYDSESQQFSNYTARNSTLNSDNINSILAKDNGDLLLSTDKGISCFSPEKQEFTNWTKEQGLMVTYFNPTSGTRLKEGQFLFGGTDGVIEFDKDLIIPKEFSTRIILSDFQIFYHTIHPGDEKSPLSADIDDTDHLVLKNSQNIFSIKVSSINYDYPSDILYSWRLKGFYDEWSRPSMDNTIRFTNILPGEYKLQIRAISNENTGQILDSREINIRIQKPFWQSYWAFTLYFLLLFTIAFTAFRMMVLRKQKSESMQKIKFFIDTAHDIRTPLTLIKAPLEELKENEKLSETGQDKADIALRNVSILLNMTNNLLKFEQAHNEARRLTLYLFELNAYFNDMCNLFKAYAEIKSVQLVYNHNFKTCYVWFDKDKMDSIVKNLLSNAIKYSNKDGIVELNVTDAGKSWMFEVKDNGIGIPEREQKDLFKRHVRGSNAINSKISGSGIGLMLVSKLVKMHYGEIDVTSKQNEGATFKLTFPKENKKLEQYRVYIKENNTTDTEMPFNDQGNTRNSDRISLNNNLYKILVVEDNDELRKYLKAVMSEQYRVETACNGKDGLEKVESFQPDLIISDIMMPEMRGDEMCNILKTNIDTSHIHIILLTALDDEKHLMNSLKNGADDFTGKPFKTCVLKAKVANLLENRKRLQKKYSSLTFTEEENKGEDEQDETLPELSNLDLEFIARIKSAVEENMNQPSFNVDTLCAIMNMSRTSFYHKIKALTDQSPADYVRVIKLKKAAELLKSGQYNITEVAEMTGFNDAKYFREVFKKYFLVSPSQYSKGEK